MKTPFLGPAYVSRSAELGLDRCINLYPEIAAAENKVPAKVFAYYGCPGLDLKATVGSGPIRALGVLGGTLYTISGTSVYQINPTWGATKIGTLANASGQASIVTNGSQANVGGQVGFADGANFYAYANGSFITVAMPFSGTGSTLFQDGIVVCNQIGTNKFFQSNIYDLTTWQALNFGTSDGVAGPITGLAELHNQIFVFKASSFEVWVNVGLNGFVFQRLQGVQPYVGCLAPSSIAGTGDNLFWVGAGPGGKGSIYMARGYEAERISSQAIDYAIQKYPTISDAVGYAYSQEGHDFYVVSFPSGNETWCYDVTASAIMRQPMWHQRAAFAKGAFSRHWAQNAVIFNNLVVVGDYRNGNIYAYNLDNYLDNGTQRKWVRSWPALKDGGELQSRRFNALEFNMQTGTVPDGTSPLVMLRYTDDAANWSSERFGSAGRQGQTDWRVKFNRLGMCRRGLASNRTFELSSTDPFKVALMEAEIA